jgi:hypothetical protein
MKNGLRAAEALKRRMKAIAAKAEPAGEKTDE